MTFRPSIRGLDLLRAQQERRRLRTASREAVLLARARAHESLARHQTRPWPAPVETGLIEEEKRSA